MPIIAIVGPIGSGKTLYMTRCAYKEYVRYYRTYRNNVVPIVSNYHFNGIPFKLVDANELFEMRDSLENKKMFIDEMHIFLDSRSGMNKKSKKMTYFILQTRHLGVDLYFTTQDIGQVDVRLRRQVDFLVYCTKLKQFKDYFKIRIIDYRDIADIKSQEYIYNGNPYYNLYKTKERIDILA